jgi:hypothetical protein
MISVHVFREAFSLSKEILRFVPIIRIFLAETTQEFFPFYSKVGCTRLSLSFEALLWRGYYNNCDTR